MSATITCDVCGKELRIGWGNPIKDELSIALPTIQDPTKYLKFNVSISYTCNFHTTNIHWCKKCLLKRLYIEMAKQTDDIFLETFSRVWEAVPQGTPLPSDLCNNVRMILGEQKDENNPS